MALALATLTGLYFARGNGEANREHLFASVALSGAKKYIKSGQSPMAALERSIKEGLSSGTSGYLLSPREWISLGGSCSVESTGGTTTLCVQFRKPTYFRKVMVLSAGEPKR